jgi:hypothetical protein
MEPSVALVWDTAYFGSLLERFPGVPQDARRSLKGTLFPHLLDSRLQDCEPQPFFRITHRSI